MANSDAGASGENPLGVQYQVFLSFRGPDTRRGFTNTLCHGMTDAGIRVFMDDEELRPGERISQELLQAIDNSKIYMPIFSKNYASSHWCLRELAKMVENISESEEDGDKKVMLPIFYNVKPNDVKLKTALYSGAISNLEQQKKNKFSPKEVENWRWALSKVDDTKGWELENYQGHGELVKVVVDEVMYKLKLRQRKVTDDLVGIDDQLLAINTLLDMKSGGVRLVGIHGMGGIGKTTIAKIIFNQLTPYFGKYSSFLDDVREKSQNEGLVKLQERLLSDIVNSRVARNIDRTDYGMNAIGEILGNKKVLIVLDDVDESEQIKDLIGKNSLYPGTRILVTTRKKRVLKIKGFKYDILSYEMEALNDDNALQLFSRHAFGNDSPPNPYYSLSKEIVSTTGGLPLALQVIGAMLSHHKERKYWEETLDKSRRTPHKDVLGKLRISYDALESEEQQIFLDIACFLINEEKINPIYVWKDCDFSPEHSIDVLINMSMIKVLDDSKFWMHDQFRDLGRAIVRQENLKHPNKRSRVWNDNDALNILRQTESKKNVQALKLQGEIWEDARVIVTSNEIRRFRHLWLLWLKDVCCEGDFTGCLSELKWIRWRYLDYPSWLSSQVLRATNLCLGNLVVAEISGDQITDGLVESLIMEGKKLKVLTLERSLGITRIPSFPQCSTLERLTLQHCAHLVEIDCSIGNLRSLVHLNIYSCKKLEYLPEEIGDLINLQYFSVRDCSRLSELPDSLSQLTLLMHLDLSSTLITRLPDSIGRLKHLVTLKISFTPITKLPNSIIFMHASPTVIEEHSNFMVNLRVCKLVRGSNPNRWELPNIIGRLRNLEELYAEYCKELEGEVPPEIGELSLLRILSLKYTGIDIVPRTIGKLCCLHTLDLEGCDKILTLPKLPDSLIIFRLKSQSLVIVPNLSNLTNLVELLLSDGSENGHPSSIIQIQTCDLRWIGKLSKLKKLKLCILNVPLPTELSSLPSLSQLTLTGLDLQNIRKLPSSLLELELENVNSIDLLSSNLRNLIELRLFDAQVNEIHLDGLSQLEKLTVRKCKLLKRLCILSTIAKLKEAKVSSCARLVEIRFAGALESLEKLSVEDCYSMRRLDGLSNLKNLKDLRIQELLKPVIEGLDKWRRRTTN